MFNKEIYKNVSLTMVFIITLDQNLSLKIFIIKQDFQFFNPWINSLNYTIFVTPVLFMTLLNNSLSNPIPLFIFFNHKLPIEKPERNMIFDPSRKQNMFFFLPIPSTLNKDPFQRSSIWIKLLIEILGQCPQKISFFYIIDCISCFVTRKCSV